MLSIAIALMLAPLKVMSSVIGIMGDLVGMGVGLVGLLAAATIACTTVAIAWMSIARCLGIALRPARLPAFLRTGGPLARPLGPPPCGVRAGAGAVPNPIAQAVERLGRTGTSPLSAHRRRRPAPDTDLGLSTAVAPAGRSSGRTSPGGSAWPQWVQKAWATCGTGAVAGPGAAAGSSSSWNFCTSKITPVDASVFTHRSDLNSWPANWVRNWYLPSGTVAAWPNSPWATSRDAAS